MSETVRTRFAPSPTGFMHIGNLRTGLYAYLFARKNNGKFILRIEDTDQERKVEGAIEMVYRTLATAGITYDEGPDKDGGVGPYIQTERMGIYKEYAKKLVELGVNEDKCMGPFFLNEEEQKRGNFDEAFRNKVIMYLFEDAAKYHNKELFAKPTMTLGELFDAWKGTKLEDKARAVFGDSITIKPLDGTASAEGEDSSVFKEQDDVENKGASEPDGAEGDD